jgi:hypothetical protein
MGTTSLSKEQGDKGVTLTTHPYLAPRLKKEFTYTSTLSLWALMACSRVNFTIITEA